MKCFFCGEDTGSNPIRQSDDYFCSLECANSSAGFTADEEDSYYEENDITESLQNDYDE